MCCPCLWCLESEGENFAERPALSEEVLPAPWEQAVQKGALPVTPAEELAGHSRGAPACICRAAVGCCP